MKKKIALGLGALAVAVTTLPLFAAFEAHVINVTAKIENALNVNAKFLDFGTVFPQEKLEKPIDIALSQSFIDADRVDDVEYFIRQKPKCAITWNNGTEFDATLGSDGTHMYTTTGHITFGDNPATQGVVETDFPIIDCGPAPRPLDQHQNEVWGPLPNLCPYLSKHSEIVNTNPLKYEDGALASFHQPWIVSGNSVTWNDVFGRLAKSNNDKNDRWMIDLAVPCFGNYCAQDWASFVLGINPNAGDPNSWTQPISNEHKVFGCDLWVEVSGVSTKPDYNSCGTVLANAQGQFPPSGTMLNPADYSYTTPTGDTTAGNAADHKWVHLPSSGSEVVWDMGTPTKAVTLIPSIDHLPIPAEAKEATLHGSDFPIGPWEAGIETATYNDGPSTWISDDYTTRWVFTKPYKYVRATVGGTLQNDGDAEIDAVCSAK